MGWTQSHLYRFEINGVEFGEPDPEFGLPIRSAKANQLRKVASEAGFQFLYAYDFGDSWEHQIVVEEARAPEQGVSSPRCVAGERACPPEDCGVVWGYDHLLEVSQNPRHPEYKDMRRRVSGPFDAEAFDLQAVNDKLAHLGPSPWD